MKNVIISIRIPEEIKNKIDAYGNKKAEFIRNAIIEAIKREEAKKSFEWIKRNMIKMDKSVVEMIRYDRER